MPHYIWERTNWTNFSWQNNDLLRPLGECRLLQGAFLSKLSAIGFNLESQTQIEMLTEETLQTAAIEGAKYDARAVRSSVARKLGLPSAGLPVNRNIDGIVSVLIDATQNHDKPLTRKRILGWQAALFPAGYSGIHKIKTGQWRTYDPMQVVSGPIGHEQVHFEAPPSAGINEEMRYFIHWWEDSRGKLEGLLRAAIAHFRFVTIHPFEDGNGRIARALTDMALSQDDRQTIRYYSLSSQIMAERDAYYNVLERCQKSKGDITEWLAWFLGCFSRAIKRSEERLSVVLDKVTFWQTHAQASLSERQRKVINRMLEAGKDGFEGGMTTRKYMSLAGVSRATAFRELDYLLELGIIKKNPAKGRSSSYELNWPQ